MEQVKLQQTKNWKLCCLVLMVALLYAYFSAAPLLAQSNFKVQGEIVDAQTHQTLPGVNVLIKGTTIGTASDSKGHYELNVSSSQDTLIFSYIGYREQEIPVGDKHTINVSLQQVSIQGQQLVVVGYGTEKKVNLTGSVSTISSSQIEKEPMISTSAALMGKAAGVTVLQNSNKPGSGSGTIYIHGIGTLGDSSPLVLIDGVQGSLDGVDPNDIASISILKDAASAAIYGSRAANGVILITTKKGSDSKFQVKYNGYIGFQSLASQPQFVNGGEYMKYMNIARQNQGQDPLYTQTDINNWYANYKTDPNHYPNTNWINTVYSKPGMQQQHHISVSGGNKTVNLFGALTYDDQNGNIPNYSYKRYNLLLNTHVEATSKLNFNFDISARRSRQVSPGGGDYRVVNEAFRIPDIYAAQYTNGDWGPGWGGSNPLAYAEATGLDHNDWTYLKGTFKANYEPLTGLRVSLMYAPEYDNNFYHDFTGQFQVYDYDSKALLYTVPDKNSLTEGESRTLTNNLNVLVNYQKDIGDNHFKGLVGYELIDNRNDWFTGYRDSFILQNYPQMDAGGLDNQQSNGSAAGYGLQSYFGRIDYNYRSTYLFEANLRYDGSSRFAPGHKYGWFPSFSVGWRLSQMPFMHSISFISNLKLRASWGELGNQNIGNYPFASVINLNYHYIFGNTPVSAAAQTALANQGISWETTKTEGVGLDAGFFNDRLTATLDYYIRRTTGILLTLPIPMSIGMSAPYQNAGGVKNTGWDLNLDYNNALGNVNYSIGFNISNVHNEVTDLKGTGPYINGSSIIEVGHPINAIYGYKSEGLFQSQTEINNSASQTGQIAPGDIKYADLNGDGVIDAKDRTIIGDPFPHYSFGLNLSASYKNFDISAFIQGVGKKDILMSGDIAWAFYNGGNMQVWQENYWTPKNPNAAYPRLTAGTNGNNYQTSSFWVKNAAYARLRNLQIGYTLPNQWFGSTSIKRLRIYLLGQNLFTIDKMPPGWSPTEPNNSGGNYYPVTALYSVGIDLTF